MEAVTKASQIMALHAQGKSTREIALEVYGQATESQRSYVRVVVGQRKGQPTSVHDRAYLSNPKNYDRKKKAMRARYKWRWRNEPGFKEQENIRCARRTNHLGVNKHETLRLG